MPPVSIMVKPVSGLCNMRCRYCFYADELSRRESGAFSPMSRETLENLMRRAFAYADEGVYLAFQGGEPTLAGVDFFRQVLELERRYNTRGLSVQHAIQTNGLCLDEELLAVLKQGQFLVGLSLDGTRTLHDAQRRDAAGQGTYARVLATAQRLRRAGVDYNVLCVVGRSAARQPREVFEALAPHGYLQLIPRLDPLDGCGDEESLAAEDYGRFLIGTYDCYEGALRSGHYVSVRAFDNWLGMLAGQPPESCGFAGCCAPNYLVESNGNVYPCDFYALDEWLLGNINETSFRRLAASEAIRSFCESARAPHANCLRCRYGGICRGGCRRDRQAPEGGVGLNRLCGGYRMFFDARLERMTALRNDIRAGRVAPRRP